MADSITMEAASASVLGGDIVAKVSSVLPSYPDYSNQPVSLDLPADVNYVVALSWTSQVSFILSY